ncbi:MAG: 12,18-didecarboxysiroheme deacetylase [Proteobacteria bacterium]|nr:12,18-didecarboxysiroheme deacetylase [Pseudomonadota bacterium]MBU1740834.1 12,18-didecarboxysiroheme deacetylase [Pseudomonadota bacterium]
MIGVSKLYCGTVEPSDALRYGRHSGRLPSHLLQFSADKKPVVVFNATRACNLRCIHCYAHADGAVAPDELTTDEALRVIDDLADFGAPVILFSGGEPLVRPDIFDLAAYAVGKGLRAVFSTNGTLITSAVAERLANLGLSYVGISLDGLEATHDRFRQVPGAFRRALEAVDNCQAAGLKVGLRFTIFRHNAPEIPGVFDLLEERQIPRICFYHLVYAGRGTDLIDQDLSPAETRDAVDVILDRTREMFDRGFSPEVLTVDNHADGPYIYLRLLQEDPARAAEVLELLKMNEGNSSGRGIGCISWDGSVHADQFWRHHSFGNVRERKFSEIWTDTSDELLTKLKDKRPHLHGRCTGCNWLDVCGGNFRVRAEAVGDLWGPDPACYLTDEEIA